MPSMRKRQGPSRHLVLSGLIALVLGCILLLPLPTETSAVDNQTKRSSDSLEALGDNFWQWRARYQPFSADDIPRIERPSAEMAGPRDWSANSIAKQKAALLEFEKQWKQIDPSGWSVARQVDHRLL